MNKTRVIKPKYAGGYYQHSIWDRLLAPFIKPCGFLTDSPLQRRGFPFPGFVSRETFKENRRG
jgi:hypothetical protein